MCSSGKRWALTEWLGREEMHVLLCVYSFMWSRYDRGSEPPRYSQQYRLAHHPAPCNVTTSRHQALWQAPGVTLFIRKAVLKLSAVLKLMIYVNILMSRKWIKEQKGERPLLIKLQGLLQAAPPSPWIQIPTDTWLYIPEEFRMSVKSTYVMFEMLAKWLGFKTRSVWLKKKKKPNDETKHTHNSGPF